MKTVFRNPLDSSELTTIPSVEKPVTKFVEAPGIPYSEADLSSKIKAEKTQAF
jgi:hypothetical protein